MAFFTCRWRSRDMIRRSKTAVKLRQLPSLLQSSWMDLYEAFMLPNISGCPLITQETKPVREPWRRLTGSKWGVEMFGNIFDKVICLIKILSPPIIKMTKRFIQKAPWGDQLWALALIKERFLHLFWELSCQSSPHQALWFISDPDTDSCYITAANPQVRSCDWMQTHAWKHTLW